MKNLLLIIILVLGNSSLIAQDHGTIGNEFWLAFMENITLDHNGSPQFSIFISATDSGNATVTAPATGLTFSFAYNENSVTEYILPEGIFYALGSEEVQNFGLRINTSTLTNVFTVHFRIYFSEASMLLSKNILGDEYFITAVEDFDNAGNSPSCFVIVATEDNSEIEIIPASTTAALRPAGVPFTVVLNEGESYQVQSLGDLTGTKVKAVNESKLAVFAGAVRSDLFCDESADNHLFDQLFPISYASQSFVLIPFKEQGNSIFKILAVEDNSEISINENVITTLQAGEFIELVYDTPHMLTSNKGVLVTQLNPSQNCNLSQLGDPTMLQLHSMEYRIKSMKFKNLTGFIGSANAFSKQCLTLFTESENIDGVFINDENISTQFQEFPGYPSYSYAMLTLPEGNAKLEAPDGVLAYAYGFGNFDAYSYALGFDEDESISTIGIQPGFELQLFPNPTLDQIKINTSLIMDQVELFDINGRLLMSKNPLSNRSSIDLSSLPAGFYLT